jgi:3-isopropylmalate/(R)-2-methylmalate dehydratase small subunit
VQPLKRLTGPYVVLDRPDVDTDQIIPARFLTSTRRSGFGEFLFHDWRFHPDGRVKADCPINSAKARAAQILVAGSNFGCGSSREHAPWALLEFGFRAVLGASIADIFRANALKVGLLAVAIPDQLRLRLVSKPEQTVEIDLEDRQITVEGERVGFEIDPFARLCLLNGQDQLDNILAASDAIDAFELARNHDLDPEEAAR